MEYAGVVALVRPTEQLTEPGVDPLPREEVLHLHQPLNPPVLAYPEEDYAVDRRLNGIVEIPGVKLRISQGDISGQDLPPAGDLLQEGGIHLGRASLAPFIPGIFIKRAFEDGVLGEYGRNLIPLLQIIPASQIEYPPFGGHILLVRLHSAVVDRELLEVGEDGQGQLCRPGISSQLEGRVNVLSDVHRGLLGLQKELALAANAKRVVRSPGGAAHLDGVLMDHILVGLGKPLLVIDIPAQGLEERIDKLSSNLGLIVVP